MRFYNIKEGDVQYLREFDNKIAMNKNETRPYVGIVLEVNGVKYYAPFSSPKPKHLKMKKRTCNLPLLEKVYDQADKTDFKH